MRFSIVLFLLFCKRLCFEKMKLYIVQDNNKQAIIKGLVCTFSCEIFYLKKQKVSAFRQYAESKGLIFACYCVFGRKCIGVFVMTASLFTTVIIYRYIQPCCDAKQEKDVSHDG